MRFQSIHLPSHRGGQVLPTLLARRRPDPLQHLRRVVRVFPLPRFPGRLHWLRTELRGRREPTPGVFPLDQPVITTTSSSSPPAAASEAILSAKPADHPFARYPVVAGTTALVLSSGAGRPLTVTAAVVEGIVLPLQGFCDRE
ncbi:hypothetical protein [Paramicrobacterium chengjingii]|uniref:hypothetical protein n=1 Tax=Paramicrobacterium chengjingii TaxID=2769067 RepID=UPI00142076ED|nr:hypothetical protein [Microbacterium chengjingii]